MREQFIEINDLKVRIDSCSMNFEGMRPGEFLFDCKIKNGPNVSKLPNKNMFNFVFKDPRFSIKGKGRVKGCRTRGVNIEWLAILVEESDVN